MNCRTFVPSIRPPKAPRHEAGATPRHLIPCRYFARGYCSRGDSCMFSHSFPTQTQGLQGNYHTTVPFWNNYTTFSSQPYAKSHHPENRRRTSVTPLSLQPVATAAVPPSPSSSSVATPDEVTSHHFNFQLPDGPSPTPSIIVSDIMKAGSALYHARKRGSIATDTSCDEFSTTRSDVTRDEFLPAPTDVHYAEFYSVQSPVYLTPVPYVQRGFGYRDKRARGGGRENRRRRARAKPADSCQRRESSRGPPAATTALRAADPPRQSSATSDSDGKPHQETWRVIGGGVMLGTPTSATSRRKLKRLQSCARAAEDDDSVKSSMDENLEFSDLVASVKLTINRPPLADIIERPKSSLPGTKVSPLTAFFTHAEVA